MELVDSSSPAEILASIEREAAGVAARLAEARQRADEETQRSIEERVHPLRHEDALLQAQLDALDGEVDAVLRDALARGRAIYREHCTIQFARAALAGRIQAVTGKAVDRATSPPYSAYVIAHVRRFDAAGAPGDAPAWAREEQS